MTIVTCKPASILSETLKEVSDIILELDGPRRHAAGAFTQLIFGVRIHPQPRTKSVRCATCGDGVARLLPEIRLILQATVRCEESMTLFFVCCNPSCGRRCRD
nr:unnamed protein product [Digitaria exilis]